MCNASHTFCYTRSQVKEYTDFFLMVAAVLAPSMEPLMLTSCFTYSRMISIGEFDSKRED
ncbi:MAG: hypothetical protein ACI82O_001736 [Patiriisocius sp.]|jgi:hypothetical protein